ncbi:hypothetical protein [Porphyromonas gulae]|uniref:hypothetical protein n=1 Tax=Porphyromonas gulae TaxID=111105 RepID=UPI00126A3F47|nr:hypothetical protein [Porphyromonas gulae]
MDFIIVKDYNSDRFIITATNLRNSFRISLFLRAGKRWIAVRQNLDYGTKKNTFWFGNFFLLVRERKLSRAMFLATISTKFLGQETLTERKILPPDSLRSEVEKRCSAFLISCSAVAVIAKCFALFR